jgi:hypothetical protein
MIHRRLIGSILALALLAGSTFVPLARAACAAPKARTACPACAGGSAPAGPVVSMDRSCCAAPASLSEREPATVSSDRSGGPRVAPAVLVSSAHLPAAVALAGPSRIQPRTTGASPPHLRTTLLRI